MHNATVFKQVVAQVVEHAPNAIVIVASNPVDIMTDVVCRLSALPAGRVFGTGTMGSEGVDVSNDFITQTPSGNYRGRR